MMVRVPDDKVKLTSLMIMDMVFSLEQMISGVAPTKWNVVTPKSLEQLLGVTNFICCLARYKSYFYYAMPLYAVAFLTDEDFAIFMKKKQRRLQLLACLRGTLEMITNICPLMLRNELVDKPATHAYTDAALEKSTPSLGGVHPESGFAFRVADPTVFFTATPSVWLSVTFFEAVAALLMIIKLGDRGQLTGRRLILHIDSIGAIYILMKGVCSANPALQAVASLYAEVCHALDAQIRMAYIWTKRNTGDLVTRSSRISILQETFGVKCVDLIMNEDFKGFLPRLRTLVEDIKSKTQNLNPPKDMKDRHHAKRMKLA
jgi:hypothetical protein